MPTRQLNPELKAAMWAILAFLTLLVLVAGVMHQPLAGFVSGSVAGAMIYLVLPKDAAESESVETPGSQRMSLEDLLTQMASVKIANPKVYSLQQTLVGKCSTTIQLLREMKRLRDWQGLIYDLLADVKDTLQMYAKVVSPSDEVTNNITMYLNGRLDELKKLEIKVASDDSAAVSRLLATLSESAQARSAIYFGEEEVRREENNA